MKPKASILVSLLLCAGLLAGSVGSVWAAPAPTVKQQQRTTPGVELAKTISMVTGVAISPLLGVGAIGAYQWYNAPTSKRASLQWYAQPWFWIPALLLVALIGAKDVLGTAAPTALKKPFDVAETIENKVSGLIAAGAFLPLIISIFPEASGHEAHLIGLSPLAAAGFGAIDAGALGNAVMFPFLLAIFIIVWLASHAINILILLSPFTTVDTLLKSLRLGLISLLSAAALINPWVGALLSAVVIAVAYMVAGWSLRLTVLGAVFIWDLITFRSRRFQPGAESNKMFTARKIEDVPMRTYGRLARGADGISFQYRPWLMLPKKMFKLHSGEYVVGKGLLYPEVARIEGDRLVTIFLLSPRYCGHEEGLARAYGLSGVREVGLRKGLRAGVGWLRSLFSGTSVAASNSAPVEPERV